MPDPSLTTSEAELRAHVERALTTQYELDSEIGRGGMGIVYRARDRRLKRHVAVKLLPPELAFRSEIRSRFLREAETAAQLSHPNIVPIYTVGEQDNLVFFVMAYISGDNLAKRLHDKGRMSVDDTRRVLIEVAEALAYAHARGVVHRDIKPDNILLDAETGRAMVTDFGIARAVSEGGGDSRLTATGMAIGTPAYMSPEQCAGEREIDGRSDLYSLGIVGYQMLTGELPFAASNTPAMLVKHISEAPLPIEQRRADLPPDLARAIMMLLEKEPANRFPSASALAIALENGDVPALPVRAQPLRSSPAPRATHGEGLATLPGPTSEELQRFNADPVAKFRRKLAFYGFVSPILFLTSVVGNSNFMTIWVFWTIYIAYQYAKLWTDGFDWRDVFRQPRHRSLYEVATETIDDMQGLLDKEKRQEVLERARQRRLSGGSTAPSASSPVPELLSQAGRNGGRIQQAALDRDEIVRLVDSMPAHERSQIPDVIPSARALYDRIQQLALSLADLERNVTPGALDEVEREIVQLEAAANPLERAASETRVRRLAHLKRQRRALSEVVRRRDAAAEKLETCSLALQNMRFDVLRLRAGAQTHARITSLAVEAMNLARDIDTALYAAGEVDRLTGRGSPRAADAV